MPSRRTVLRGLFGLGLGSAVWLPLASRALRPPTKGLDEPGAPLPPWVEGLLARHLALWEGGSQAEIDRLRESNPEWDFMGRTFLVLALVDLALADPPRTVRHLAVIDRILADTAAVEAEHGQRHFLLPYADWDPWVHESGRSVFVDGEIGLMGVARLHLADEPTLRARVQGRLAHVRRQMEASVVLSAESYPDECWTFCNTTALAALRLADPLFGTDHRPFARAWLQTARARLVDPDTGLLVSSYRLDGTHLDGPEGSSIWWAAHNLRVVDRAFAVDQYERARGYLARHLLGFGYAREWPETWEGPADIDSGPIVPFLEASAGSSGLALVGAGAFDDRVLRDRLLSSLRLAAFPTRDGDTMRFLAANVVGDAVILYALVQGPLFDRVLSVEA